MQEINTQPQGEIVIYKDSGGSGLRVKLVKDSVWLNQIQMARLFEKDVRTINEHIQNVYKEAELSRILTTRKFRIVQAEGNRKVARDVEFYNLDVIISVGYRVRSKRGTQFRIWATAKLRDYILKGYAVNAFRLKERHEIKLRELESTMRLFQSALKGNRVEGYEKDLLKIITDYTNTWVLLSKYDEGDLKIEHVTKKGMHQLSYDKVKKAIEQFKKRLIKNKEASVLFGREVESRLKALLGNIEQTFEKDALYASVEERAAHVLYLTIRDQPFVDGNKRIGSLLFLLYLVENNYLYNKKGERKLNDNALAALALLIAESKPENKDTMIGLIVNLINKK